MVPACSIKVSRVSMYSGYRHVMFPFAYGAFTLSGRLSQNLSARIHESILRSEPRSARTPVWPLSISLAATLEIDVSFSSSGYLDVSVHRVPFHTLWIGVWMHEGCSCRFPHSDICGSMDICSSPQLFAAYHVFRRLLVPRHPPCALVCLTSFLSFYSVRNWVFCVKNAFPIIFGFELSFLVFSDVLIKYISSKSLYEVFKVQSSTLCVAIRNCNAISVYFKILGIYLKHFQILLTVLSVIRNFNLLKPLITHKTILFYNPAATCFPIPSPV